MATVTLVLGSVWWIVALPPFSVPATSAVLAAGAAAALVGAWPRRPPRPTGAGSAAVWGVLAGAAGVWQLAAYLQHPRIDHPTLSSLANAVLDSHPARAAGFVVWMIGAMELARR